MWTQQHPALSLANLVEKAADPRRRRRYPDPLLHRRYHRARQGGDADLSSLRMITYGGAPLPVSTVNKVLKTELRGMLAPAGGAST